MITIKGFASLCSCTTQTLRYYDKMNLLKPVKVDPWSGYRYYTESQAIDFVKIKNLRAADFTIEEIKTLLHLPEQQIYEAFERKIAEQAEKLERIIKIQQSYLAEKNHMEKLIERVSDYIFHGVSQYHILEEFGLSPDKGPEMVAMMKKYVEKSTRSGLPGEADVCMVIDGQVVRGADQAAEVLAGLKNKGYDHTVLLGQ